MSCRSTVFQQVECLQKEKKKNVEQIEILVMTNNKILVNVKGLENNSLNTY